MSDVYDPRVFQPDLGSTTYHVIGLDRHERSECSESRCGLQPLPQLLDTGTIFASVPAPEWQGAAPQTVENLSNELCVGAEPDQPTVTQDELLTALDELLDSALHDDRCYIHENDTECVCVIGKVRAALPPCGAVKSAPWMAHPSDKASTCHRNAHPSSPDRHVF